MKHVFEAAADITRFIEAQGWSYCIIGGLAVVRWGRARATVDVDVTLLSGFGKEEEFIDALLRSYSPRRPDAREFALISRVLLLQTQGGVGLDVALAGFHFEERLIERATLYEFLPGLKLMTASGEDLIITKAFAGRPRDWSDIEGVVLCQTKSLDWELIISELSQLCDLLESRESLDQLLQLRDQLTAE
ncbi:MAG: DUF6036 family nucleotidyltransferase [Bythopirellula sp.]|nr:DUF6036 family nucleotidyltransferase [Bythopirellula sp.]